MKVAFFSDCYLDLTGGIVSSINAQKSALEKNGHTVYVFSSSYPKTKDEQQKLAEVNIFPVPSCYWCFRGLTPVAHRPRIIEKWLLREHPEIKDCDIFYVHYEAGCSIAGLRLGKKLHIPTIQVMHGREDRGEAMLIPFGLRTTVASLLNWFHSWYLPHPAKVHRDDYLAKTIASAKMWSIMVNHANYADFVLTPSEHFRKKLVHYGITQPSRAFPNAFPDAKFPANPPIRTFKPNEPLEIIWHSRVSGEKRVMVFLDALTKVEGKYHCDIYGGGPDLKKAQRFAKRHHLNTTFHGDTPYDKVQDAITKAHLDVLVSYNYDTFGMTLIEAEAYGTPVLFCDPDMQEVVPEGSYVMSKNETADAIAEAINEVFSHPEKIEKMSQVMLKHRDDILISKRIKQLEEIFRTIKS